MSFMIGNEGRIDYVKVCVEEEGKEKCLGPIID